MALTPCKFTWCGDSHSPKPSKLPRLGDVHGVICPGEIAQGKIVVEARTDTKWEAHPIRPLTHIRRQGVEGQPGAAGGRRKPHK